MQTITTTPEIRPMHMTTRISQLLHIRIAIISDMILRLPEVERSEWIERLRELVNTLEAERHDPTDYTDHA